MAKRVKVHVDDAASALLSVVVGLGLFITLALGLCAVGFVLSRRSGETLPPELVASLAGALSLTLLGAALRRGRLRGTTYTVEDDALVVRRYSFERRVAYTSVTDAYLRVDPIGRKCPVIEVADDTPLEFPPSVAIERPFLDAVAERVAPVPHRRRDVRAWEPRETWPYTFEYPRPRWFEALSPLAGLALGVPCVACGASMLRDATLPWPMRVWPAAVCAGVVALLAWAGFTQLQRFRELRRRAGESITLDAWGITFADATRRVSCAWSDVSEVTAPSLFGEPVTRVETTHGAFSVSAWLSDPLYRAIVERLRAHAPEACQRGTERDADADAIDPPPSREGSTHTRDRRWTRRMIVGLVLVTMVLVAYLWSLDNGHAAACCGVALSAIAAAWAVTLFNLRVTLDERGITHRHWRTTTVLPWSAVTAVTEARGLVVSTDSVCVTLPRSLNRFEHLRREVRARVPARAIL
ncbi:MAG: hypothetical protein R3A52_23340 [Polyangiales bacterium]